MALARKLRAVIRTEHREDSAANRLSARARCFGTGNVRGLRRSQPGDLATLEELAFRDPASALPQLATAISTAGDMPPTRRAALHAIAADASRQLGFSRQTITHTDAGLALLPAGDMSDLAIRMRTVRALVSTNVGGIDAAAVELTRLIEALGNDRPLALGCLLRDRGWLNFRDGNPDQALDDLLGGYKLLRQHAGREEAMVAAGRLSMAQFSVRDYPQALVLVDETIAFFREQKAQIRLATALDRRTHTHGGGPSGRSHARRGRGAAHPPGHWRPRRHGTLANAHVRRADPAQFTQTGRRAGATAPNSR